ncbi:MULTISPECIES: isochorismate synthase [Gordonia]|jgi:isochorismate synthase|uniref:isochorismate synthase n=1 Tax=Gordonia TaxID=2053 RepID=UPI0032B37A2E
MNPSIVSTRDVTADAATTSHQGRPESADPGGFLFCRNEYHVIAAGVEQPFADVTLAASALRDGSVRAVVGAIPFDTTDDAALWAPQTVSKHTGTWTASTRLGIPDTGTPHTGIPHAGVPHAAIERADPDTAEHRRRVVSSVRRLADPSDELEKVVLARTLRLSADGAISPWEIAARMRAADSNGSVFVTDLSAASGHRGAHLVGASPEVLICKRGTTVTAHPLAGSSARHPDPRIDAERGRALKNSTKDHTEHRYVVDALAAALTPLCDTLHIPEEPVLMTTPTMWHLGTPIEATITERSITSLDLALAVHPTPAICGTPTRPAREHILATEGPRGFYAGAVGWSESATAGGDGEWMVTIRCAEIAADGRSAVTWAGGGIVAASDPDAEVSETESKFAAVLDAFRIDRG